MRALIVLALLAVSGCAPRPSAPQSTAVLFEGARLIVGDERPPIENAAFVVENGAFTEVGRAGAVQAPAGAARVSLAGKTVMPAIIDAHGHMGYRRGASFLVENYTRENLIHYLNRYAYYGIGAIVGLGTDAGDLAFQLREQQQAGELGGAMLYTAGRGLGPPNAGSGNPVMRSIAYDVETEEDARKNVRELAAKRVNFVKFYVDDRNKTVPKLRPELYRAIIDEAHKHGLRVVAHVYYLSDAKDLVRAGVDGFSHLPRDEQADDELAGLMMDRNVFVIPSLSLQEAGTIVQRPPWFDDASLRETIPAAVLDRWSDLLAARTLTSLESARREYTNVQRGLAKLSAAGVRIAFGIDYTSMHIFGFSEHREMELMVAAGMTPRQVIVAATRTSADILGLNETGMIELAKSADFIVLEANPLDNIANSRRIGRVYLRGEEVDRAALRSAWNARSAELR